VLLVGDVASLKGIKSTLSDTEAQNKCLGSKNKSCVRFCGNVNEHCEPFLDVLKLLVSGHVGVCDAARDGCSTAAAMGRRNGFIVVLGRTSRRSVEIHIVHDLGFTGGISFQAYHARSVLLLRRKRKTKRYCAATHIVHDHWGQLHGFPLRI
jgi:hypothetical protein